jgi:hypothetical protein
MSNLVDHARRELELISEDEEAISGYLRVVQAFADMGHSGSSAAIATPVINRLLQFKNISPLTEDPSEWFYHGPETWGSADGSGIWQNTRDPACFSTDGGKTYYRVDEQPRWWHRKRKIYVTASR